MDFGKIQDADYIEKMNFALPPDSVVTQQLLNGKNTTQKTNFLIGCTGWAMKEWVGRVYPYGTKSTDFLTPYAQQWNTIELNTTHYRTPTETQIEAWKNTPDDFIFAPKMLQTISHDKRLSLDNWGQVDLFCDRLLALEQHLGYTFLQLPPTFKTTDAAILLTFLEKLEQKIPLALELRHESWFENGQKYFERLSQFLMPRNVATVITDVAGRRDVLHQCLTSKTVLIRFVGNSHSTILVESDKKRIVEWAKRLKNWVENGIETVYFFTHAPDNLFAPELAFFLIETLEKEIGLENITLRKMKTLAELTPNTRDGGQMSLF
ncbi:MAG: hypothetical protein RL757_1520 [Bacteroidota bacterium]|jgi:uncharacterized protein YecE (DUF72 family)